MSVTSLPVNESHVCIRSTSPWMTLVASLIGDLLLLSMGELVLVMGEEEATFIIFGVMSGAL